MGERTRVRVVTAEIQRNGAYLLTQRLPHAVLPLLWEFPGGRVHDDESDRDALVRSVQARIGCRARVGELVMEVTHPYDTYDLTLAVYRCDIGTSTPKVEKVNDIAWVGPEQFADYRFPGADQKTVDLLLADQETVRNEPR
ncbi:MAG: (deoxy)nucleoside triphosphate pyrophosphohydrolase [Myxococcota bacterium]